MRFLARILLLAAVLATGAAAATPVFRTSPQASVLVCGGSMMAGDSFAPSVLGAMRLHYGGCRTVALVLHASHPADRDRMEQRLKKAFAELGPVEAVSLHRSDAAGALALLRRADGIFIGGGETFVLLAELARTGQLDLIRERTLAGIPSGGASAGANVAGLLIGTTNDFPVTDVPTRAALAVFPAVINPHHPAPEPKGEFDARRAKILLYQKFNPDETVLGLGNASIVRLHRGETRLLAGQAWLYPASGTPRELVSGARIPELEPR